jgi:hypothetical protein
MLRYKDKILCFSVFTGIAIFFLIAPFNVILNFAHDDSFFYLKIAKNFSEGFFSTFDKVSSTNGYHPLYLMTLSVYFSALRFLNISNPELLFRFTCILHVTIITLSIYFFIKAVISSKGRMNISELVFLIMSSFCFIFMSDYGTETHLSFLFYSLYLFIKFKKNPESRIKIIINSVIIGFMFLIRIDYLVTLVPAMIFADYITSSRNNKVFVLSADLFITLIFSVAYFTSNILLFGSLRTASSIVLNSFPDILFFSNLKMLITDGKYLFNHTLKFAVILACLLYFFAFKTKNISHTGIVLLSAIAGLFLNLIIHLTYNKYNIREWYISFPFFLVIILLISLLNFKSRHILLLLNVSLTVIFIISLIVGRIIPSKWESSYEYAKSLNERTNENDLIYKYDYSGVVSFFSERNILNGDGFVNTVEYAEKYLQNPGITEYFFKTKINYLSTISYDSIKYDANGNYIFSQNERFLNVLRFSNSDIVFIKQFSFNHPIIQRRGYWILLKTKQ